MNLGKRMLDGLARFENAVSEAKDYLKGKFERDVEKSSSDVGEPVANAPVGHPVENTEQQELLQRIEKLELEVETQKMLAWCAIAIAAAAAVFSYF